jgi:hypothetical protein
MSIPDLSHDETIFPDSHAYIPERWLNDPKTADGVPLDRFMVSFGRGTRACVWVLILLGRSCILRWVCCFACIDSSCTSRM